MKTEREIKERLKEAKGIYNDRRKSLRLATGSVTGDNEFRKVIISQLYGLAVEIDVLEWVLQK